MSKVMHEAVAALVRDDAFLDALSQLVAVGMEKQLRAHCGGESIYITKTTCAAERKERDKLIRECFSGNNIDFLASKFGLHPRQIRRICKK